MPDSNPHSWFAIRVKGNRDQVVSSALSGRGYETFLPTHKDPRSSAKRPPHPGYVLSRLDVLHRVPVLVIPGVVRFVGIGNSPRPIPDEEVESLRQVAKSGLPVKPEKYFAAGDKVRIESGPLAGTVGTVLDWKSGVFVVPIHFLQRSVSVRLPAGWLARSSHDPTRTTDERLSTGHR